MLRVERGFAFGQLNRTPSLAARSQALDAWGAHASALSMTMRAWFAILDGSASCAGSGESNVAYVKAASAHRSPRTVPNAAAQAARPRAVAAIAAAEKSVGNRRTPERGSSASTIQRENAASTDANNNIATRQTICERATHI